MQTGTLLAEIEEAKRSNTTRLSLRDLHAEALPPELGDLAALTNLHVYCDNLSYLPREIGRLVHLTSLKFGGGKLKTLPSEIRNLQHLKHLSLTMGSDVEFVLPGAIGDLSSLELLEIRGNIAALPSEIGRLKALRHVDISGRLSELPEEIGCLKMLKSAWLSNNQLVRMPASVGDLAALESLHVNSNSLEELPEELGAAVELRDLYASSNRLRELPRSIGRLAALEELGLEHNLLKQLPSEIGGLSRLRRLELQHNSLLSIPPEIGRLRALTHLDLTANRLTQLPREIGQLVALTSLRLMENGIRTLPVEAAKLTNLVNVELHENQPNVFSVVSLTKEWDVFISHASKDEHDVAIPLAEHLRQAGLRVWLDKQEIRVGESIRQRIDDGLARSRFGIVILSKAFFEREWTARELGALLAMGGEKVILPVWHDVDKSDVLAYSPMLADIAAANTRSGLFCVAAEIVDKVLYGANDAPSSLHPSITRRAVEAICVKRDAFALRSLLLNHGRVLKQAYTQFGDTFDAQPSEEFGGLPAMLVSSEQLSADTTIYSYLLLGSFDVPMFDDGLQPLPALDLCIQEMIRAHKLHGGSGLTGEPTERRGRGHTKLWGFHGKHRIGHDQPSVIVSGRRHGLSLDARNALNCLNAALADSGIRVRSYDWLIDAFRAWQQDEARHSRS